MQRPAGPGPQPGPQQPGQQQPGGGQYPPQTRVQEPVAPHQEPQEPYWEQEPYEPQEHYPEPDPYRDRRSRRENYGDRFQGPSADSIGRIIQVFTALVSFVFVLHIIFVATGANQDNDFVSFVYSAAKFFVLGLGDVFTPKDATIGVVLNYGLAALIYLVLGRIIARALKR